MGEIKAELDARERGGLDVIAYQAAIDEVLPMFREVLDEDKETKRQPKPPSNDFIGVAIVSLGRFVHPPLQPPML